MAKRKRLTPAQGSYLAPDRAPEVKMMFSAPPIAQVAGEAAATAALREVAGELSAARAEGRLVQRLPLGSIVADHLVRDRMAADPEELRALRESIRARGQQAPIEVVELDPAADGARRFGLISGWRRLKALQELAAEGAEPGFQTIQALMRRPEQAADAYLAMVEENEIRVGLSYYERARIVARAAELEIFASPQMAVRVLFSSASRAKRSKITSFLVIYHALDVVLFHGSAIPERLGLALAQALENRPGFASRLKAGLRRRTAVTEAGELAILTRAVANKPEPEAEGARAASGTLDRPEGAEEIAGGVYLQVSGGALRPKLTLSGPNVDAAFRARLEEWLRG